MQFLKTLKSTTGHAFNIKKITKHVIEIQHSETKGDYFVIPSYGYEVRENHNGSVPVLGVLSKAEVDHIVSEWVKEFQNQVDKKLMLLKDYPHLTVDKPFQNEHGMLIVIYENNNWNELLRKWNWESDFFEQFELQVEPKM